MSFIRVNESTRKRPVTKRQRALLANQGKPWVNTGCSDFVKKEILKFFPDVELIHNPVNNTVHVYRILQREQLGSISGGDILIHEFKVKDPVGSWLVAHLLQHDSHRKYAPNKKLEGYMQEEKEAEVAAEIAHNNKISEISNNFARDLAFAARGRESSKIYKPKLITSFLQKDQK